MIGKHEWGSVREEKHFPSECVRLVFSFAEVCSFVPFLVFVLLQYLII